MSDKTQISDIKITEKGRRYLALILAGVPGEEAEKMVNEELPGHKEVVNPDEMI